MRGKQLLVTNDTKNQSLPDNLGFIRYDAFGKSTNVKHDTLNKKQFTGKEIDEDSGLYYFLARYYDADTGRFLSEDPTPKINLYVYCDSNRASRKALYQLGS
jgi:RHS repeat-associated protein